LDCRRRVQVSLLTLHDFPFPTPILTSGQARRNRGTRAATAAPDAAAEELSRAGAIC
jgi:hypothetical protein